MPRDPQLWLHSHRDDSSPGMCQLLQAACQCSSLVYDQKQLPDVEGIHLEPLMHRTPSMTGTVKAASMWKIADVPVPGWSGKTLVVSIRGTASGADHMVNMNGAPRDASSFLVGLCLLGCAFQSADQQRPEVR